MFIFQVVVPSAVYCLEARTVTTTVARLHGWLEPDDVWMPKKKMLRETVDFFLKVIDY